MNRYNIYEVRHGGHYSGDLSIVVASDEVQAAELTKAAIQEHGIKTEGIEVRRRLNTDIPRCFVLDDGDY